MTNQTERLWRIQESKRLKLDSIIKLMSHWGLSRRTAREYLEVLKEIDNGK